MSAKSSQSPINKLRSRSCTATPINLSTGSVATNKEVINKAYETDVKRYNDKNKVSTRTIKYLTATRNLKHLSRSHARKKNNGICL